MNTPMVMFSVWLILAMFLAALEIAVPGTFLLLSASLGSVAAGVAARAGFTLMNQLIVAAVGTVAAAIILVGFLRDYLMPGPSLGEELSLIVGRVGVVVGCDPKKGEYRVRMLGTVWRAVPVFHEKESRFQVGSHVRVVAIRGATLVVAPVILDEKNNRLSFRGKK